MPKNKGRAGNQAQPRNQPERSSTELVRPPVPSLIEGTKTEVIYYKPGFTNQTHYTKFYVIYDPEEKRCTAGGHHNDMT